MTDGPKFNYPRLVQSQLQLAGIFDKFLFNLQYICLLQIMRPRVRAALLRC